MSFPLDQFARLAVDIGEQFSETVQSTIMHRAWVGKDLHGNPTWAAPVSLKCIIDNKQRVIVSPAGQLTTVMATLTFTIMPASNGAAGRREPIDPQDIIALPDGFSGPIVSVNSGTVDPSTGKGFILEVSLGAR